MEHTNLIFTEEQQYSLEGFRVLAEKYHASQAQLQAARERINELENAVLPQEYCDPFSFVLRQLRDQRVAIQRLIEMLESLKPSTPAPDMK